MPAFAGMTESYALHLLFHEPLGRDPMTHAIRIKEYGGPEVLSWDEVEVGQPGPGQVKLRQTAVGLNYVDTYQRSGLYKMPLPFIAGSEAAGVVEAVAPDVKDFKAGDHVAYAGALGAYTEARVV